LAIAVVVITLIWFVGIGSFLLVHLPITFLAGSVGIWLFYVQHQFEQTFWAHGREWNFYEASLHGSSYYDLPGILLWFTANIGVHHSTICVAVYPTTGCHKRFGPIPICVASAGSLCFKAFAAFGLCCGMRAVGG
jgi:hypothetical protein